MKKKYSLLITLAITYLFVVLLTWFIPNGTYYYGKFSGGSVDPIGIVEFFKAPFWNFSYVLQFGMLFLLIGGFYGVLNKTGAYSNLLEGIAKKFKKKPQTFAIITVIIFTVLSSFLGGSTYLFLFVPMFISALLMLGFSKVGALLATVGSLLIGTIGSTYGFDVSGYINYYASLDINAYIFIKLALLVAVTALLIVFVLKTHTSKSNKKEEKKEDLEIPLYVENHIKGKSFIPLIVILIMSALIILVGTFNWSEVFGITVFTNSYNALMEAEVLGYPLFANVLGGFSAVGNWSSQDVGVVIILMSALIGWLYSVSFKDIFESFVEGMKQMIPTFVYVTLSTTILMFLLNSSSGEFINYTIIDFVLGLTKGFNVLTFGIATFINAFFVNYFPYFAGDILQIGQLVYTDATVYPIMALIAQSVYGLAMFFLPTSVLLIAGLSYLKISFKDWMKNVWRFLLCLLGVVAIMIGLSTLFL